MSNPTKERLAAEAIAVVRRNTEEVQGRGDFEVFEQLFAPTIIDHTPQRGFGADRNAVRALYGAMRTAFPDFTLALRCFLCGRRQRDRGGCGRDYSAHQRWWRNVDEPIHRHQSWALLGFVRPVAVRIELKQDLRDGFEAHMESG